LLDFLKPSGFRSIFRRSRKPRPLGRGSSPGTKVFSVNNDGVLKLAAAPAPIATNPDGYIWNDNIQKTLCCNEAGIRQDLVGCIFSQTENKTVSNVSGEVSLFGNGVGTTTLPANFWTVGKSLKITIMGFVSSGVNRASSIRVKIGSVTIVSSINETLSLLDNNFWEGFVIITCRSIGATGSVIAQGRTLMGTSADLNVTMRKLVNTTAVQVNTTISSDLDITYEWENPSTSNSVTTTNVIVEVVK
jgi:hypothetical protein